MVVEMVGIAMTGVIQPIRDAVEGMQGAVVDAGDFPALWSTCAGSASECAAESKPFYCAQSRKAEHRDGRALGAVLVDA